MNTTLQAPTPIGCLLVFVVCGVWSYRYIFRWIPNHQISIVALCNQSFVCKTCHQRRFEDSHEEIWGIVTPFFDPWSIEGVMENWRPEIPPQAFSKSLPLRSLSWGTQGEWSRDNKVDDPFPESRPQKDPDWPSPEWAGSIYRLSCLFFVLHFLSRRLLKTK